MPLGRPLCVARPASAAEITWTSRCVPLTRPGGGLDRFLARIEEGTHKGRPYGVSWSGHDLLLFKRMP